MTTDQSWSASPVPYTISLYVEGEGYPTVDQGQADLFFERVNTRVAELINDVLARWERGGGLYDPNFRHTVILVGEHNSDGALGVVLNRTLDVIVEQALPTLSELVSPGKSLF